MKTNWSVLAVYQEPESQKNAVLFCDELVRRFWDKYEFTVSWLTHDDIRDPNRSEKLCERFKEAQLLIVEAVTGAIPSDVFAVLESHLRARSQKEGLLAGIAEQGSREELALRNLAHRNGLDYISEVPPSLDSGIPDSPESCATRAHEVSNVLSEILRRPSTSGPPLL